MATWNGLKPLQLYDEGAMVRVRRGERIPTKHVTQDLVGAFIDQLTNLSQKDMQTYQEWKRQQVPAVASRWDAVEKRWAAEGK